MMTNIKNLITRINKLKLIKNKAQNQKGQTEIHSHNKLVEKIKRLKLINLGLWFCLILFICISIFFTSIILDLKRNNTIYSIGTNNITKCGNIYLIKDQGREYLLIDTNK